MNTDLGALIVRVGAGAGVFADVGMYIWSGFHTGHWNGGDFALSFSSTLSAATACILGHEGRLSWLKTIFGKKADAGSGS